jgi:hypothetical protein
VSAGVYVIIAAEDLPQAQKTACCNQVAQTACVAGRGLLVVVCVGFGEGGWVSGGVGCCCKCWVLIRRVWHGVCVATQCVRGKRRV